jgi:hypothetical protein
VLVTNDDYFCNSKKAFIDFLKVDSLITITGKNLSYKKTPKSKPLITVKFDVETNNIPSNKERYFIIALENNDEELVDAFCEVGNKIKELSSRINPNSTIVNTLWDDVGRYYAYKSYPLINEVENVMRKLISKFMLINVGMDWSKETIHPDLVSKIERFEENDVHLNDLYKLDFIHLSDVLFKKKRDINLEDLDRVLSKTKFDDVDKIKILKYLPKSNWEKYFYDLLGEKSQELEGKWEILYKLRNKVAHNRFLTREDFQKIKGITTQVKETLLTAMNKLGEIDLNDEDRSQIIHSYHSEHPASLAYLAERSVAEYYLVNGFEIEIPKLKRNHYSADFIIKDPNGRTAIEIKTFPSKSSLMSMGIRLNHVTHFLLGYLESENLDRGQIVAIFTSNIDDMTWLKIKERIKFLNAKLNPKISIITGIINEQNIFEPAKI